MTRTTIDSFEQDLLAELRAHVAERANPARRHRRFLQLSVSIAAAAAVAGAFAVGVVGPQPAPAFAVDRQGDGAIAVTVNDLSDAAGLEQALKREGVTAVVDYEVNAAHPSDLDAGGPATNCPPVGTVTVDHADSGGIAFTLDAELVAAHATVLYLTAAGGRSGTDWAAVSVKWTDGTC